MTHVFVCILASSLAGPSGLATGETENEESDMGRLQGEWLFFRIQVRQLSSGSVAMDECSIQKSAHRTVANFLILVAMFLAVGETETLRGFTLACYGVRWLGGLSTCCLVWQAWRN